jgi:hypothetical protein
MLSSRVICLSDNPGGAAPSSRVAWWFYRAVFGLSLLTARAFDHSAQMVGKNADIAGMQDRQMRAGQIMYLSRPRATEANPSAVASPIPRSVCRVTPNTDR